MVLFYNCSLKDSLGEPKILLWRNPFLFLSVYNMFLHIINLFICCCHIRSFVFGVGWGDGCSRGETRSDLHRQQRSLLPSSFFQSPWYVSPAFPSSHGLLWRGAEINALMASEPGGRHPIYHEKVTFAFPQRDCKQQIHCRCRCWMLGLKEKSGQGRNM